MSQVQGIIQGGSLAGTVVLLELPTVRFPELPNATDPQGTDEVALYQDEGNKLTKISLTGIVNFVATGGDSTLLNPVVDGNTVEIPISAGMAGQSQVNVPVLANKQFKLFRNFQGKTPVSDFLILPSGGFQLKPKDPDGNTVDIGTPDSIPQVVNEGEFFWAEVYDLTAQPITPNTSASLFSGIAIINTDTQLSVTQIGKLIHAAFGSNHGTITLEDIADAPANTVVAIETMITNSWDVKIQAKSGQNIYFGNTSQNFLYLGKSEFVWLLRGTDGWYITNCSERLLNVGDISHGYKQKLGTLVCKGQEVNRADYPRLWQWVQSLGTSLVTDDKWNTTLAIAGAETGTRTSFKPYEGCFSYGTGGTGGSTFRLPNLQEKFLRALNNIGSSDAQRNYTINGTATSLNIAGNVQTDINRKHKHKVTIPGNAGGNGGAKLDNSNTNPGLVIYSDTDGGYEARSINVGLLPLINT